VSEEVAAMARTTETGKHRPEHRIVVGVDGSEPAKAALNWAAAEAKRRGAVLQVLCAYKRPPLADGSRDEYAEAAQQVVDKALVVLSTLAPEVVTKGDVHEGSPAPALLETGEGAELLVVGSRGHGGFTGLLLGSVSHKCVHHGRCPVVVVRPTREGPATGRIVVGVDGSGHADEAVRFAATEAVLRHRVLRIVHAWQFPPIGGYVAAPVEGYARLATELVDQGAELARSVALELEIETLTSMYPAAEGLLRASEGAELLVVGARGHGGFGGLLVGSVSQECVSHAPCPVVVVRH
jgi:nucleotide-binding universal stress UspA family protein